MRTVLCLIVISIVAVSISASPADIEASEENGRPVDVQLSDGKEYTLFDVENIEQGHENVGAREARQFGGYGRGFGGYRGGYGGYGGYRGGYGGYGGYRGGYGGYRGGYGGYRGGYRGGFGFY